MRTPAWPGYLAASAAVLSMLLLLVGGTLPWVLGYLFGALATPTMAVVHRLLHESARKNPWFVRSARPGRVVLVAASLGILTGLVHVWLLATELAKR